jgi:hypothetical protein
MRDIRVDDHRATELVAQQFSDLEDWERQIQREQLRRVSFGHDAGEIPRLHTLKVDGFLNAFFKPKKEWRSLGRLCCEGEMDAR